MNPFATNAPRKQEPPMWYKKQLDNNLSGPKPVISLVVPSTPQKQNPPQRYIQKREQLMDTRDD